MSYPTFRKAALAAAVLSLGIATSAFGQAGTTTPSDRATRADTKAARGAEGTLASKDRKFIEAAAQGGMAEVQLGKLAEQKASSEQVKEFARRMVQDHGKANEDLKQIASSKGVQVPAELDRKHKRDYDRLQKLSGAEFDREYMKHMVDDHKKDVSEFKDAAKDAKDAELKSFASKTLPTLEQHLTLARSAEAAVKGNKQAQGATGTAGNAQTGGAKSKY